MGFARFFYCLLNVGKTTNQQIAAPCIKENLLKNICDIVSVGEEKIVQIISDYAEPLLEDMGLELVEVQFRREGHGWVLRLFIDSPDGINVDDCAAVSREISAYLDVEDVIEHHYSLEVSSPGLERALKKRDDFIRFSGRKARVKLREPLNEQRVFVGIIQTFEDDLLTLVVDEAPVQVQFDLIAKARLSL